MRFLLLIILGTLYTCSYANHLMGGEITYEYISGKKYNVKVTLYRDCNDCKFAGEGGGSSTNNCSDLTQVFVRTISSACGANNVGSINLTKTGFENITEICNTDNSRCGNNPTVSYGIEAHYYSGTIDFEDYTIYSGCAFQLFIHKSERSSNISSIVSEQDQIYTYAQINPWQENISSPYFRNQPKIVFYHNQATYTSENAIAQNGDSLHYSWGTPLTGFNTLVSYTSGYTASKWMTAYCAGATTNCPANPTQTPPTGLYLNRATGDFVITPTSSNEKTIRVIEVEQWRKYNGLYYLAGKIRREAIALVIPNAANNAPKLVSNPSYTLCVGQPFNQNIHFEDIGVNSLATQDSVSLKIDHTTPGLQATVETDATAPYAYAELNFTPAASQVGKHYVSISATDNQCPNFAKSTVTIELTVVAKPDVSLSIDQKFCGTNTLNIQNDRDITSTLSITADAHTQPVGPTIFPYTHQYLREDSLHYQVRYTDNLGCTDSLSLTTWNLGTSTVPKAQLQGNLSPCSKEINAYTLEHTNTTYSVSNVRWNYKNDTSAVDTLLIESSESSLKWKYSIRLNEINCPLQDSVELAVVFSPEVSVDNPLVECYKPIVNLNKTNPLPHGGQWTYLGEPTTALLDVASITRNMDTTLPVVYTYTDPNTGCSASKTASLDLKKSPELRLRNQSMCSSDNQYFLTNAIELPYAARDRAMTWNVIGHSSAINLIPRATVDVPALGKGTYYIEGVNTLPNGCSVTDTAILTVTDKLVLAINETKEICQSNAPVRLNDLLEVNVEGGFWECDVLDLTNGITVNTEIHCGEVNFKYIYDQNYCYAELESQLSIVCKPDFSFVLPDSVCTNATPLPLPTAYNWISTDNIALTALTPSLLPQGITTIIASQTASTCSFDTVKSITVLAPLSIDIAIAQEKLCEGDSLHFEITQPSHSTTSIYTCESQFLAQRQNTYIPTACDLTQKEIELKLESTSTAHCPSSEATIRVPYYRKPPIYLPENISGCEPYAFAQVNLAPEINYNLSANNINYTGTSTELNNILIGTGVYSLSASKTNRNGCTNNVLKTNFLSIHPKPSASFSMGNAERLTLSEREISLYNYSDISEGSFDSKWYYEKLNKTTRFSTASNPTYQLPADTGVFKILLVAESDAMCRDTATNKVLVVPDIIAFIPSAFTPDNKGPKANSVFRVTSDHAQEYSINIFNKWGQKVYSSTNIEEVWDGTYMGNYCQNGVYVYAIVLINKTGKEYTYQGTVNLIR